MLFAFSTGRGDWGGGGEALGLDLDLGMIGHGEVSVGTNSFQYIDDSVSVYVV